MTASVLIERKGAIGFLTLNRPEAGNAINLDLARGLRDAVDDVAADPNVRCIVLRGGGRMFCVGGDVKALEAAGRDRPQLLGAILAALHPAIDCLARMDKPLITAVHGPAAGAGLGLAVVGDIVLAEPAAHFTMAYSAVGLTPDGGTSWLLPRLVGLRRAQELALTNRRVPAAEAAAMGLVTRLVAEGTLCAEVSALAENLANGPSRALAGTRRLLFAAGLTSLTEMLAAEREQIVRQGATAESFEGLRAFVERRKPDFHCE